METTTECQHRIRAIEIEDTEIPDVKILRPRRFKDDRGFFSVTFHGLELAEQGLDFHVVQENHSMSETRGVLRGLHYQISPYAQAKLIRVVAGAIYDVAVDLRRHSPHFGRYVAATISADIGNQILVPEGFAHGFCTLEPRTEVVYLTSEAYAPQFERGIRWDDPELNIDWPVTESEAILSEKDRQNPNWSEVTDLFE